MKEIIVVLGECNEEDENGFIEVLKAFLTIKEAENFCQKQNSNIYRTTQWQKTILEE